MAQKNYTYKGYTIEIKFPRASEPWETSVAILKDSAVVDDFIFEYDPSYALSEAQERIDLIKSREPANARH